MSEEEFLEELTPAEEGITAWDWEDFWLTDQYIEELEEEEDNE